MRILEDNLTRPAATALVARRLLKLDTNLKAAYCVSTGVPLATSQRDTAIGEGTVLDSLRRGAVYEVSAGAAIAVGAQIVAAADGQVVTVPDPATGHTVIGRALTAATAADQEISFICEL